MLVLNAPWDDPLEALPPNARLGVTSRGILAIRHLPALLGREVVFHRNGTFDAVIAWGDKAPAARAATLARSRQVPLLRLEDAVFRSVGLGKLGMPPVGVMVDDRGIYFDASQPSRLESILTQRGWESAPLLKRAQEARHRVVAARLSKYNIGIERAPAGYPRKRVLLVDQVAGDRSIAGAGADRATFQTMLEKALATHDAASIILRRHPDVARGLAQGFLEKRVAAAGIDLSPDDLSVDAVLEKVDEVWTVSSQIGFDALLRGKPVVTFGMPFYAGFGLTNDQANGPVAEQARTRRRQARTVDELFAAAAILTTRYADPVTARPIGLEAALDRLVDWRQRDSRNRGLTTYAYGFGRWKRARFAAFTAGSGGTVSYRRRYTQPPAGSNVQVCVWGVRDPEGFEHRCRAAGLRFLRVEDGFLRSIGLGSDFIPPGSLVFDPDGIYYDASRPSALEQLLAEGRIDDAMRARARALRHRIVAKGLSKYNLQGGQHDLRRLAGSRRVVLVIGQVPGDAATRLSLAKTGTVGEFVAAVRSVRPDAFIAFKEHPDIVAGNRLSHRQDDLIARQADIVLREGEAVPLFEVSDEVHVLSSLAGFEALIRNVPVTCWASPFYAGWGLTNDMVPIARRTRKVDLDELLAAALILYPQYLSPFCAVPCGPEDFVEAMLEWRRTAGPTGRSFWRRQVARLWLR